MIDCTVGRVVRSKAGRDKGRYFIVLERSQDYALIADGGLRGVTNPKRKKLRHLLPRPEEALDIKAKLLRGDTPLDSELRKSLREMAYDRPPQCEDKGGSACQNRT